MLLPSLGGELQHMDEFRNHIAESVRNACRGQAVAMSFQLLLRTDRKVASLSKTCPLTVIEGLAGCFSSSGLSWFPCFPVGGTRNHV